MDKLSLRLDALDELPSRTELPLCVSASLNYEDFRAVAVFKDNVKLPFNTERLLPRNGSPSSTSFIPVTGHPCGATWLASGPDATNKLRSAAAMF